MQKKPNALRQILGMLIPMAIGAIVAIAVFGRVTKPEMSWGGFVGLILVAWSVLALHELGHLAGGRLAGFQAILFACGPLLVIREGSRFRVRYNRNAAFWGGVAASVPTDSRDLRRRTAMLVAGGPVASLLIGVAALLLVGFVEGPVGTGQFLLGALGALSLAIGFITLVPGTTSGFYTDGARLLRLLRGGPEGERDAANLVIVADSMAGTRPREWDPAVIERAIGQPDGSLFEQTGRLAAVAHHLDSGRVDLARPHMDRLRELLDVMPAVLRSSVLLEGAFIAAHHDHDPESARALLAGVKPSAFVTEHQQPLAEAAIAIAEGRPDLARPLLDRARKTLEASGDPAQAKLAADRVEALERACSAESAAQPGGLSVNGET